MNGNEWQIQDWEVGVELPYSILETLYEIQCHIRERGELDWHFNAVKHLIAKMALRGEKAAISILQDPKWQIPEELSADAMLESIEAAGYFERLSPLDENPQGPIH